MFKVIMVLGMLVLAGCNSSRDVAKAYAAGCSAGINEIVAMVGVANEAHIAQHCDEEAQKYVGEVPTATVPAPNLPLHQH